MPITKYEQKSPNSRVVAVEEFNDLGLTQEMAAGVLILYNVMHVVLQCFQ